MPAHNAVLPPSQNPSRWYPSWLRGALCNQEGRYGCVCAQSLSRLWLFVTPLDWGLPGSSIRGVGCYFLLQGILGLNLLCFIGRCVLYHWAESDQIWAKKDDWPETSQKLIPLLNCHVAKLLLCSLNLLLSTQHPFPMPKKVFCFETFLMVKWEESGNAGDMGSTCGPGRPHMQQSNYTREQQLPSRSAWGPCSTIRKATEMRKPCIARKSSPCLPQLETACAWQQRPSTPKNKVILFF